MEKTIWNIRDFNRIAEKSLPHYKVEKLKLPVRSIPWKFQICRYHVAEYQRILNESFARELDDQIVKAVGKILKYAACTEEGMDFGVTKFTAEAHVIAFAQALHSTADILANILYFSLDLCRFYTKPNIYFFEVVNTMKKNNVAPKVLKETEKFLFAKEFKYLKAYVNTTKHQSLVESNYSVRVVQSEEKKHGLKIKSFDYKSKTWDCKWVDEFINDDFNKLSNLFGKMGCALNEHMEINYF